MVPIVRLRLNDRIVLKKPHPCGGSEFRILRVGSDVRIVCQTCGRDMTVNRIKLERPSGRCCPPGKRPTKPRKDPNKRMNKFTANPSGKLLADDSRQLRPAQQGRLRRFFGNYWFLLLCMAVPALLMYLIYFAREIYPIGDGSVLVLDLNGQYVWFFEALRNFFPGDAQGRM